MLCVTHTWHAETQCQALCPPNTHSALLGGDLRSHTPHLLPTNCHCSHNQESHHIPVHTAACTSHSTSDMMHSDTMLFAEVLLPNPTLSMPRVMLAVLQQGRARKLAQIGQKGSAAIPWGWGYAESNAPPWGLRGAGSPCTGGIAGSALPVPAETAVAEPSPCPRAGAAPSYLARHSHGSLRWRLRSTGS